MLRLGRFAIYLAIFLVVGGLAAGFGALFSGYHDVALKCLSVVPAGVLLGFAGLVLIVLNEPRQDE
jgi:hypothetical protein